MAPTPTERMADPTLILAAEPVLLPDAVLEGPAVPEVLVPVERTEPPELWPEEAGTMPLAVGRAA